jgi:hypothetical protein
LAKGHFFGGNKYKIAKNLICSKKKEKRLNDFSAITNYKNLDKKELIHKKINLFLIKKNIYLTKKTHTNKWTSTFYGTKIIN